MLVLAIAGGFAVSTVFNNDQRIDPQQTTHFGNNNPINAEALAVDPCVLFTKAEIEQVFHTKFADGIASEDPTGLEGEPASTECSYRQNNDGSSEGQAKAYQLKVQIETHPSAEKAKNFLHSYNSSLAKAQPVVMRLDEKLNIGDEAYFYVLTRSELKDTQEEMQILKDHQIFRLTLNKQSGLDHATERNYLRELAEAKF